MPGWSFNDGFVSLEARSDDGRKPTNDDLAFPPKDECAHSRCGRPAAAHIGWVNGGPSHEFEMPAARPRPERVAEASIETKWQCTHCGALCMVEGVADHEWMECDECQRMSYIWS